MERRHSAAGYDYTTGQPPLRTAMNTIRSLLFFHLFTTALRGSMQENAAPHVLAG
jgi:hypothetical protein